MTDVDRRDVIDNQRPGYCKFLRNKNKVKSNYFESINRMESSRVWPVLVESSLDASLRLHRMAAAAAAAPSCHCVIHPESLRIETEKPRACSGESSSQLVAFWRQLNSFLSSLPSSCQRLSGESLSEACFVSGVITATVGALIAISGIFTRNQVSAAIHS